MESKGLFVRKPAFAHHVVTPQVSWGRGKAENGKCEQVTKTHQDSKEFRKSGVVGSGLRGGEVTKAAALAQFLLQ